MSAPIHTPTLSPLKNLYLNWLAIVYALYCFFNKGIAYTYLVELTWLLGLLILLKEIRNYQFVWRKETLLMSLFLLMTAVYTVLGMGANGLLDTIRDSFVMNYAFFAFIVFMYLDDVSVVEQKLANVYAYFPAVVAIGFLLRTVFPDLNTWVLIGNHPFFEYKNGDLAVHLFICLMFMMNNKVQAHPKLLQLNYLLIGYLALISSTYSRGGMVALVIPLAIYFFKIRKTARGKYYLGYLKFAPLVLLIALPLYSVTKFKDNVQGRKIGVEQLAENVTSIVNKDSRKVSKTLNDNIVWRLNWWGKIIDYTFAGPYFLQGKGLGVNLSVSDDISGPDDSLRSPHNYSMTLLARYGVPFFIAWIFFLGCILQPLFTKHYNEETLLYSALLFSLFLNASFDVSFEGPVMATPFWIFVGILLIKQVNRLRETNPA